MCFEIGLKVFIWIGWCQLFGLLSQNSLGFVVYNNRNLFFTVLEIEVKIKVLAGSMSGEDPFCIDSVFLLCFHMVQGEAGSLAFVCKGANPIREDGVIGI